MRSLSLRWILPPCIIVIGVTLLGLGVPAVVPPPGLTASELGDLLPAGFAADPERGEVLYNLGGCGNCHSDAATTGLTGGVPTGGPALESFAGDFFPPNLTPDVETGIGGWTDAEFVNAMKFGISPAGTHYYPAFPYTSFAKATAEDLLDLKAYLDGLEPVKAELREHGLKFPFNIRQAMFYWNLLFHDSSGFVPDASRSREWNRGAYLVNALGHCGVCHTPRGLFWSERHGNAFEGGEALKEGEPGAPGIAGIDKSKILNGLDEWSGSIDESSSMYLVTQSYSAYATNEDLDAVATYLSGLPSGN